MINPCLACQHSIHRHNNTSLGHIHTPDDRFAHVYIDLVGPLPNIERLHILLYRHRPFQSRIYPPLPSQSTIGTTIASQRSLPTDIKCRATNDWRTSKTFKQHQQKLSLREFVATVRRFFISSFEPIRVYGQIK